MRKDTGYGNKFFSTTTEFKEIDTLEPGSWINLVNPSQNESLEIANAFDIDIADLRAPLDAEEMSRITIEDEYTLIIVDVPITEERTIAPTTLPFRLVLSSPRKPLSPPAWKPYRSRCLYQPSLA